MHRDIINKTKEIELNKHLNLLKLHPSFIYVMDHLFKDLVLDQINSINIRNSSEQEKQNVLNLVLSINYLQNYINDNIIKSAATLQQELNSLNIAIRTHD